MADRTTSAAHGRPPGVAVVPGGVPSGASSREVDAAGATRLAELTHRVLDIALSAVLLAASAPLLALSALAVRMDSAGPAFFRQTRLGRNGRPFELLKLRTMYAGADQSVHRRHVRRLMSQHHRSAAWVPLERDPRVTAVGDCLRRFCIDEIPQLLNVLKGDMSLVGPRPAVPYEAEQWSDWQMARLAVRPGITGLWQVAGRGRADFETMVQMDLDYIARRTPLLDLQIIARTPIAVLRRRKAP